jgi:hypothetical protein
MFGIQQIIFGAVVGAVVSFVVLYLDTRFWHRAGFDGRGGLVLSLLVGCRSCCFASAPTFHNSTTIRFRSPVPTILSARS